MTDKRKRPYRKKILLPYEGMDTPPKATPEDEEAQPEPPTDKTTNAESEFKVGYRKPPREHQFKKGQSGNPKGRPKGSLNIENVVRQVLTESITITVNGKSQRISAFHAMLLSMRNKAIKSDPRAFKILTDLASQLGLLDDDADGSSTQGLSANDREVLDALLSRIDLKKEPGQ
jgi:uncharacterized protein DUF5681